MKIVYQGRAAETSAVTVAGFLAERQIPVQAVVLELNGEICGGPEAETRPLCEGDVLDAFRIVPGG
ncbi:MAG: sulfur carrier protein ThiS [Victivallaceae bacterium]|nr:sulfur carrier protein ThiS [Victivallaceae bacterium]